MAEAVEDQKFKACLPGPEIETSWACEAARSSQGFVRLAVLPFGSVQDNIKTFRWPLEISAHLEKGWKYCSKVRVALRERLGGFSRGLV